MKALLYSFAFCLIGLSAFAQSYEEAHAQFLRQVEERKVDSIYEVMLKADETNPEYKEILVARNQLGFLLNKTENLKEDIPAVLALPEFQDEGLYQRRVMNFQDLPPSEWSRFIDICGSLETHFKEDKRILREVLMLKTFLEFMSRKTDLFLEDMPKLMPLIEKGTEGYYGIQEYYAKALIKSGETEKGIDMLKENFRESNEPRHLHALMSSLAELEGHDAMIKYAINVKHDTTSGSQYFLGKAYLSKGKFDKAQTCFDLFTQKLEYDEREANVYHKIGFGHYSVDGRDLMILADFYAEANKEKACELYDFAFKVVSSDRRRERSFQRQMTHIFDEAQRKEIREDYEKDGHEREAIRKDVEEKLKGC